MNNQTTPEPLTPEKLAELKGLYEQATPGEWRDLNDSGIYSGAIIGPDGGWLLQSWGRTEEDFRNADNNRAFVAALHNAFPALLQAAEENAELREKLAKLEESQKLWRIERMEGRREALSILLRTPAENFSMDYMQDEALADTGDYMTCWKTDDLRKLLDCDSEDSFGEKVEASYWEQMGINQEFRQQIEAHDLENEELGRMLKEKGMREEEFLPGFLERLAADIAAKSAEVGRLRAWKESAMRVEALGNALKYFEDREDADHDGARFMANEEMSIAASIREALASASTTDRKGRTDGERLESVESLLRHMPHAVIAFNDDPAVECECTEDGLMPVGFRIAYDGCEGTSLFLGGDLREAIDKAMDAATTTEREECPACGGNGDETVSLLGPVSRRCKPCNGTGIVGSTTTEGGQES